MIRTGRGYGISVTGDPKINKIKRSAGDDHQSHRSGYSAGGQ